MANSKTTKYEAPYRKSFPVLRILFVLIVVLPTIIAVWYSRTSTAPLYISSAQFAVEDRQQSSAGGLGGFIASIGISSGEPNSIYTVKRFLESPDALSKLEERYGFQKYYSAPNGDWLTRLKDNATPDEVFAYYKRHIIPRVSTKENIVILEVRAFDASTAHDIAFQLLKMSEEFVNGINSRALDDQVTFHQTEMTKAQERLVKARTSLTSWRNENGAVDPMAQVELFQGLINNLEIELTKIQSDVQLLKESDSPERFAPRVQQLLNQASILNGQIKSARERLASTSDEAMSQKIEQYERLVAEMDFSGKQLEAAFSSLETSRQIVLQQQKYLLLISNPSTPSDRAFPRLAYHVPLIFISSLMIFGALSLFYIIVRDYKRA